MSGDGALGAKKLRRIRAITGIDAVRGWASHPTWEFRDAEDRHYRLDTSTEEWAPVDRPMHYTSCESADCSKCIL